MMSDKERLFPLKLYLGNMDVEAAKSIKQELLQHQNSIKLVEDISILEISELCTYIKKTTKCQRVFKIGQL